MIQAYAMPGLRERPRLINKPKADAIVEIICEYYCLDIQIVKSKWRKREVTFCRQVCMYFLRQETALSLKAIAKMFSGRDHTTTIHSLNTVKDLIQTDESIRREVLLLGDRVQNIYRLQVF